MLKSKVNKKALAVQVLLGLMVAGNACAVDCSIASAAEFFVKNHEANDGGTYTDGGANDANATWEYGDWGQPADNEVLVGNGGKFWNSKNATDDISGATINIQTSSQAAFVIKGGNITGNTVNIGNQWYYLNEHKLTNQIFQGNSSGNIVNINYAKVCNDGGVNAGANNTLNVGLLVSDSLTQPYTLSAGTINVNDTVYLKNGSTGTQGISDASSFLVFDASAAGANGVININADNVTAKEIKTTNGTVNVYGNGTKAGSVKTGILNIGSNGSLETADLNNVDKVVIDGSADATALTLTSGSIDESKINLSNAVDANSSALFVKSTKFNVNGKSIELNKTVTGIREQAKSLVETQIAAMALTNGSADLLAGAGFANAAQAVKDERESGAAASEMVPFAAANYGSMRQESGSYVDVDSANFNVGFAKEVKNSNGTLLFGPMIEYGHGNYESHLGDGTIGTGNGQSFGVGVMARQINNDGLYYEGSARYGKSTSDYSSNNLVPGRNISYDNSANYWGVHAGVGKVLQLQGDNSIDVYGKLFYTRQGSSSVDVDGDTLDFDALSSKRSRIGFRYIHGTSKVRSVYAGLAWQYEFDGAARATANGFSTPSPSVKGSSGMLELGVLVAPKASPVSFDLGVSGWAGKQKGYAVNANMCWHF